MKRYISGQKGYEKTDIVPVIAEEKEKLRAHKTWYTSLYSKLFGGKNIKNNKKSEKLLNSYDIPVIIA